jgi:Outer membrane protein beta-barrel domain
MKKTILILTAASLSLFAFEPVFAADNAPLPAELNYHTGWYADARIGTNLLILPFGVPFSDNYYSSTGGWAWGADLGYSLTPHFGLEAGFAQPYMKYSQDGDNNDDSTGHYNVPYAAMKFIVPFAQRAAIFFKLGALYADADFPGTDTKSQASPFEGVGLSVALNSKVDLTTQYQGAFYGLMNFGVLSVGLTYHF